MCTHVIFTITKKKKKKKKEREKYTSLSMNFCLGTVSKICKYCLSASTCNNMWQL